MLTGVATAVSVIMLFCDELVTIRRDDCAPVDCCLTSGEPPDDI